MVLINQHYCMHESNFSWILIMNKKILRTSILLTLAITWMLAFSLPILADKSSSNGNQGNSSKHYKKKSKQKGNGDSYSYEKNSDVSNLYFNEQQRNVISKIIVKSIIPTTVLLVSLRRTTVACLQVRQKNGEKAIPYPKMLSTTIFPPKSIQLGRPPEGHRYIRVASDILLIAVGTGMIVDAIQDLNNM